LIPADFSTDSVTRIDPGALPANWRSYPAPAELQQIGDAWAKARSSVVLQVPSVLAEGENNYLLNPDHPDFHARVAILAPQVFELDLRFVKLK
jgi:RES domain-containing protein